MKYRKLALILVLVTMISLLCGCEAKEGSLFERLQNPESGSVFSEDGSGGLFRLDGKSAELLGKTAAGEGSGAENGGPVGTDDRETAGSSDGAKADAGANSAASAGEPAEGGGTIFVHVCGAVKQPGVYEIPVGSRCFEAVNAAGGFSEEACGDCLNMARVLADGERLEVPTVEEAEAAREAGHPIVDNSPVAAAGGNTSGPVNINSAGKEQLCTLPGVGESRAEAIIAYRQEHGGFGSKEDLMQVTGIKEGLYSKIEALITT